MNNVINLNQFDISALPSGKRVLVGGCFDIIHIGHVRFFQHAHAHGDVLIVALESDEFIRTIKMKEPFHTQEERAEILSSMKNVDIVVLLPFLKDFIAYENMVKKIQPDKIAVTKYDPQIENKVKHAKSVNAEVISVMDYIPNKSSTLAKDRISL